MASWVDSLNSGWDFGAKVGGALAQRGMAKAENEVRTRLEAGEFGDTSDPAQAAGALEKARALLRERQNSTMTGRARGAGLADTAAAGLEADFGRSGSRRAATAFATGDDQAGHRARAALGAGLGDDNYAAAGRLGEERVRDTLAAGDNRPELTRLELEQNRRRGNMSQVAEMQTKLRDQYLSQAQQIAANMNRYPKGQFAAVMQNVVKNTRGLENAQVSELPDGTGVFIDPDGPEGDSGWNLLYTEAQDPEAMKKIQALLMELGGNPDNTNEQMRAATAAGDAAAKAEDQRKRLEFEKFTSTLGLDVFKRDPAMAQVFAQVMSGVSTAAQSGLRPAPDNAAGEPQFVGAGGTVYTLKSDPATGATGLLDANGSPPPNPPSTAALLKLAEGMRQLQRSNDYDAAKTKLADGIAFAAQLWGQPAPVGRMGGALGGAGSKPAAEPMQPGAALPSFLRRPTGDAADPRPQPPKLGALPAGLPPFGGDRVDMALRRESRGTEQANAAATKRYEAELAAWQERQNVARPKAPYELDAANQVSQYTGALPRGYEAAQGRGALAPRGGATGGTDIEAVVDRIIGLESGGKADAKNPLSSATGAGQFLDSTWIEQAPKHVPALRGLSPEELLPLRNDPEFARAVTRGYALENAKSLERAGIPVTAQTIYMAHHFGAAGAAEILRAPPSTRIELLVSPKVMQQNPYLKGKTVADLLANHAQRAGDSVSSTQTGRNPGYSALTSRMEKMLGLG